MADGAKGKKLSEKLNLALDNLKKELYGDSSVVERVLWEIGDLISIQDLDFNIQYQNKAMKERYGDLKGKKCFMAYERKENCPDCYLTRVFASGKVVRAERIGFDKQGKEHVYEVSASPLRDDDGNIFAGIEVLRDVTEKRELEQELSKKSQVCEIQNDSMIQELHLARKVQQALIPPPEFMVENLEFQIRYQPFDLVGGDLADAVHLPDGRVVMAIADVSGHGVASSLVASMIKASINHLSRLNPSPAYLLTNINEQILEFLENIKFLTMAIAVFDPSTYDLTWCTAGHPPILHQDADGKIKELVGRHLFLGYMPNVDYSNASMVIKPGDRLIFITDGIYECFNPGGEIYGEQRLRRLIRANRHVSGAELCDRIFRSQRRFIQNHPLDDDSTLMIIDIK